MKENNDRYYKTDVDRCVCCGAIVPEGEELCYNCKKDLDRCDICGRVLTHHEKHICKRCREINNLKQGE